MVVPKLDLWFLLVIARLGRERAVRVVNQDRDYLQGGGSEYDDTGGDLIE